MGETRTAMVGLVVALVIGGTLVGCGGADPTIGEPAGKAGWLAGDAKTKFDTIAAHLGGFGHTMMEVGYRYEVLYWAGREGNWEFAAHQVEEMLDALEHGLARRPERRQSSESFLASAIPMMQGVIAKGDGAEFAERFETFRAQCNACHTMEKVSFIWIETPRERAHPWGPLRVGT